jgi:hypothetical protein
MAKKVFPVGCSDKQTAKKVFSVGCSAKQTAKKVFPVGCSAKQMGKKAFLLCHVATTHDKQVQLVGFEEDWEERVHWFFNVTISELAD